MSWKSAEGGGHPALRRRPRSLASRLTVWYASSSFALVFLGTAFSYWTLVANLDREDDELLAGRARALSMLPLQGRPEDEAEIRRELDSRWAGFAGRLYARVAEDDQGAVVETRGMSELLPGGTFPPPQTLGGPRASGVNMRLAGARRFRVMAVKAEWEGRPRVVQVALDRTNEEALLSGQRRRLAAMLVTALVACAVVGHWIARRGLRPVADITSAAQRVNAATLDQRLPTSDVPAELAALADTFNHMLDRLEDSFARLSRFSADIAHELRTPVNNLRGEAEVALARARSPEEYREALGSCLEEYAKLSRMIESLLFLTRADDANGGIARETFDVGPEVRKLGDFYEAAALDRKITLASRAEDGLWADLDRTLFQRAVANVVENALAFTPPGGRVAIEAAASGETLRVEVSDSGCGIAPEDLSRVFDRLYRGDPARARASGGVGLGLSIVKGVVSLHGGSAEIASEPGHGTRVSLVFPTKKATKPG